MKNFKNLLWALALVLPFGFMSCEPAENSGNNGGGGGNGKNPFITISSVVAGGSSVSFTLTPVNATSYAYAVCALDVESPEMTTVDNGQSNEFTVEGLTTNTSYKIVAVAYNGETASEVQTEEFYTQVFYQKKVILNKLSATSCTYCGPLSNSLAQLATQRDDFMVLAMMDRMSAGDLFITSYVNDFKRMFSSSGWPTTVVDYTSPSISGAVIGQITQAMDQSLKNHPGYVGISFSSEVSGENVIVTGKVDCVGENPTEYRICAFLMEDGLIAPGTIGGEYYNDQEQGLNGNILYNHVLRTYADETPFEGLSIGELAAGDSYDFSFTLPVDEEWIVDNCHVGVYVLYPSRGNYVVTNANEAKVGESCEAVLLN